MSLGILANDTLDIREESENMDVLTDEDDAPPRKRHREEERGFGGTLLGGTSKVDVTDRKPGPLTAPESLPLGPWGKSCSACTFDNPPDVMTCSICNTPL